MNGKSKAWALALLVGVLILGGGVGTALDRFLFRQPATAAIHERWRGEGERERDRREGYLEWLAAELQLTQDQEAQLEAIVERHREEMSAIWREMRPRFEQLRDQARAEVRALLTEEQLAAYERLLEREAERRRPGRRRQTDEP
ncbi:MAG: hypothetical protein JSV41_12365 [Gemmatimonadota bacterium]|nr:MAG: hypothetical protein JSV41_12365 [Gemmatimonadota bacterium]